MNLRWNSLVVIGFGLLTGLTSLCASQEQPVCFQFGAVKIELVFGDIAQQDDVDAIVNAGNPQLSNGAGITGAIWKAAGPKLDKYIKENIFYANKEGDRCPTGQTRVTPGFNLKAQWIIHAVGPRGENPHRAELLKQTYRNVLSTYATLKQRMQEEQPYQNFLYAYGLDNDLTEWGTLAIPMISVGIYQYPREEAAQIAVDEVTKWAQENSPPSPMTIRFVFFTDAGSAESFELYKKLLNQACSSLPSQTK